MQNHICKFSSRDCFFSYCWPTTLFSRKTTPACGFTSSVLQSRGSSVWLSAQPCGHSNLYELGSICSVKFDVEAFPPSSLSVHVSLSGPPGFPQSIARSQSSGNRGLLTAQVLVEASFKSERVEGPSSYFINVANGPDIIQPIAANITNCSALSPLVLLLYPGSSHMSPS